MRLWYTLQRVSTPLNTTMITCSSQRQITIYFPYPHSHHFLLSPLSFISRSFLLILFRKAFGPCIELNLVQKKITILIFWALSRDTHYRRLSAMVNISHEYKLSMTVVILQIIVSFYLQLQKHIGQIGLPFQFLRNRVSTFCLNSMGSPNFNPVTYHNIYFCW